MSMRDQGGLAHVVARLQAMGWLLAGRPEQACAVFDRMLQAWPQDAYALASRAHVHAQAGRREAAIADAQALVHHHPRRSAADWFNLAYLLEDVGRLDEAEAAFRSAVALDPKLDRAWYGLGLTLIRQQRYDDAIAALKRNTELQPMSPYGWYQLARVHMDRHEPEETRRIIRHLQGFEPKVAAQLQRETGLQP
ncbi:tetratricopeptide repeat protein [Aquabacterium humicola]|uniref:tetratricopeptide repeat protein n=1 Tax=Aquabacterium humicola TaxID=3237377 RepID=UPI00254335B8|nr:tetratricopeptide repeat protein [Rubrivivax pictus]